MLLKVIKGNQQESRKQWMLKLFQQAGRQNSNNKSYQLWQQSNHPALLDTVDKTKQRLTYLHETLYVQGLLRSQKIGSIAAAKITIQKVRNS
jgi:putative transposase